MADDTKVLQQSVKKLSDGLEATNKNFNSLIDRLAKERAPGATPEGVFGAPWARRGEDSMSSRGFSFMKMIGLMTGDLSPADAKVELDVHNRLHQLYVQNAGAGSGYNSAGAGAWATPRGKFLAPLATSFMHDQFVPQNFRRELKALTMGGVDGADMDRMSWTAQRMTKSLPEGSYWHGKALSWLNDYTGGALVAPPEMGELIELLRNKEALVNAGARVVPLPPQGRIKYPRQTSASTTYWVGENAGITESLIGTGEVTLQAKKLAVLIKAPNELIRFASPAAEALMRDDMTKSLALGLDLACLQGGGGDTTPLGIINQPGVNTVNSSAPTANGDKVVGQDVYRMIAAVEESNAEWEGWIMRPKTLYKYYQLRADSVAQGDGQGPFLFNLIREAQGDTPATIAGYPVTKSTQISQSLTKGTASNLTYIIGGMWSDYLIGMFGAIEFAATTMGDTSFANDQTWVRGILSADAAPRHAAAFSMLLNLDTTL